jgi:hypothetical protein
MIAQTKYSWQVEDPLRPCWLTRPSTKKFNFRKKDGWPGYAQRAATRRLSGSL